MSAAPSMGMLAELVKSHIKAIDILMNFLPGQVFLMKAVLGPR